MTGRWAKHRPTSPGFPPQVRERILQRDPTCRCTDPTCRHHHGPCTRPSSHADHITPWSQGGTHHETNGQGLCPPCHGHKTATEANAAKPNRRRPPERHPGLR